MTGILIAITGCLLVLAAAVAEDNPAFVLAELVGGFVLLGIGKIITQLYEIQKSLKAVQVIQPFPKGEEDHTL